MGLRIAVVGEPATGKSTGIFPNKDIGIKGLNPKETVILSFSGKQLPIRGANVMYPRDKKISEGGNHMHIQNVKALPDIIRFVSESRPEIKNIVLEDMQYSVAFEYMNRAKEKDYAKFIDIGVNFSRWMEEAQNAREDLKVFIIWHPEKDKEGVYSMKTVGNMISQYLTPEGLMDIILYTSHEKGANGAIEYYYITNFDGTYGARSPMGMFKELHIPNDLGYVVDKVNEYYN